MANTRILESVSMLCTFLVIFLGPGAGVEGGALSFNALIFVCVSFCISPLIFVQHNMAAHFSVLSLS